MAQSIEMVFSLKEVFSKGISVCFYQHAHETPYSIFGLAGGGALVFAEALAHAGIEYSVEGVCLPIPKRLRAGRAQRPERNTYY